MESEGDGDGAGDRQRQQRKERRSYHDTIHPSDERTLSMRSFSLWNGRNASVPPRPPHRDWQRRLKPNEPICPEVLSQSTTRTSQMSSQKRPSPTSPLVKCGTTP